MFVVFKHPKHPLPSNSLDFFQHVVFCPCSGQMLATPQCGGVTGEQKLSSPTSTVLRTRTSVQSAVPKPASPASAATLAAGRATDSRSGCTDGAAPADALPDSSAGPHHAAVPRSGHSVETDTRLSHQPGSSEHHRMCT